MGGGGFMMKINISRYIVKERGLDSLIAPPPPAFNSNRWYILVSRARTVVINQKLVMKTCS